MSKIQQDLPNKVFLPCILKIACNPTVFDDFSDPTSDPTSGWWVGNLGPITWDFVSSTYMIKIDEADYFATSVNPLISGTDFKAVLSVWISQVPDNRLYLPQYGLVFNHFEAGTKTQFYSFEVLPDGKWYVWLYDYDSNFPNVSPWNQVAFSDYSEFINPGTALNRLGVERNGTVINVYANGHKLNDQPIVDATIMNEGNLGVIAENYFPGVSISYYFDDFGVFPVTCDWSAIFNGTYPPTKLTQLQALPAMMPSSGRIKPGSR